MFDKLRPLQFCLSAILFASSALTPVAIVAQDLVPVSSITGGSSVFVFRNTARAAKRYVATNKPKRTKEQRIETVRKIKRQYETIARTTPRREKAQTVDPAKAVSQALVPAQGSIRFAGIGEFYLEKGEIDKAFEAFRDAIRLDETNIAAKTGFSEALATRGNELLLKDEASTAKGMFLEALKYDPKNSAAYSGLGEAYADLDQTAEAITNYENALENNKDLTEIYVPLGILYYQSGEITKADDMLTKAIGNSAESAETQFFMGLVRTAQVRDEEALVAFTKAKTLDPTNADAFYNTAETLARLKRVSDAIPDYQKATEIRPDFFDAWFNLGEAHLSLGDHLNASKAYQAAAKLKNNNWEVFSGLGESYRLSNEFEKAEANYRLASLFLAQIKDYDKAKEADFNSKIGLVIGQQCDINTAKNITCNWTSAIKALQRAVDATDNPVDYVNLGWAYFRAGHEQAERRNMPAARPFLESAQTALQKAVDAGPPASDFALQNLASVQIDLGDNKAAIDTLNKLIATRPDLDFARYALGVAYFKNNDFTNAEKWFRAAIDKEPKNVTYLIALGNTLISRKDGKGLKLLIQQLKALDPASADVLEKRRQAFRL